MAYRMVMTFNDIHLLQAFSNVIFRTAEQHVTIFLTDKCISLPLQLLSFLWNLPSQLLAWFFSVQ